MQLPKDIECSTYAPKEKFLVRLDEQSNLDNRQFAQKLPRMGFEMTGLSYDPSRKINKMQKFRQVKTVKTVKF